MTQWAGYSCPAYERLKQWENADGPAHTPQNCFLRWFSIFGPAPLAPQNILGLNRSVNVQRAMVYKKIVDEN